MWISKQSHRILTDLADKAIEQHNYWHDKMHYKYIVGRHEFYPYIKLMILRGPFTLSHYRTLKGLMDTTELIVFDDPMSRKTDEVFEPKGTWLVIWDGKEHEGDIHVRKNEVFEEA